MNKIISPLLLSFIWLNISGQSIIYNLANIPEAIKEKASIIVHTENIDLKVESFEKATLTVQKIFTILNDEGKHALFFNEYSSKNISLEEAEIKVYDMNGKVKEKHKKRDMVTTAVGEGLIEDGYVTYYHITAASYPITIEFNYEQKIKSTLLLPDYRYVHVGEAVIESNFTARVPPEIGLRYKDFNSSIKPSISQDGNNKIYKWTVTNLAAIEPEEGTVSLRNIYPYVALVADNFSYYGFRGDLSSWKSFGLWINQLYKDLDVLPAEREQFFVQLVNGATTETEKVRRIYHYLQHNFRYVSIQLGIGGLKPFSAEFTDKKKYGDCKALSNYMKAALKSVGIKSYVAIINAEYNSLPVDPAFPANQFNHVILCVPGKQDSTWLECTSSSTDFGELGTFTENRNALLITEDGGVLVATPKSNPQANSFSTVTTITVADDLSAETETIFTVKGGYKEMMNEMIKEKKDEQKENIVASLGFKQPDDFELIPDANSNGCKSKLKMLLRNVYEFTAGSKYFISPRINKMWSKILPKSQNRKFDYYFRFPFEKNDTTVLKLPAGIKPDVLPKEKEFKCSYGNYKSMVWYNETENSIYSVATLTLNRHKILVAEYAPVKKFFDDIMQDDSQKIVVKKW